MRCCFCLCISLHFVSPCMLDCDFLYIEISLCIFPVSPHTLDSGLEDWSLCLFPSPFHLEQYVVPSPPPCGGGLTLSHFPWDSLFWWCCFANPPMCRTVFDAFTFFFIFAPCDKSVHFAFSSFCPIDLGWCFFELCSFKEARRSSGHTRQPIICFVLIF